jgi:hypothetical protein
MVALLDVFESLVDHAGKAFAFAPGSFHFAELPATFESDAQLSIRFDN